MRYFIILLCVFSSYMISAQTSQPTYEPEPLTFEELQEQREADARARAIKEQRIKERKAEKMAKKEMRSKEKAKKKKRKTKG